MDNILNNIIAEIKKKHEGTSLRAPYTEGVLDAINAVESYLTISSHLSDTVKISELREYMKRIEP